MSFSNGLSDLCDVSYIFHHLPLQRTSSLTMTYVVMEICRQTDITSWTLRCCWVVRWR